MNIREELGVRVERVNKIVGEFLPKEELLQKTIFEAMNYSLLAGGKRIRPILMEEAYHMFSEKNKTKKIVFSGGDPLSFHNINDIKYFSQQYGKEFDICIYTGYNIEYVKQNEITGFKFIKCGTFIETQQRPSGNFEDRFVLASPNQNFYDANYNQLSKEGILFY